MQKRGPPMIVIGGPHFFCKPSIQKLYSFALLYSVS